MGDQQRNTNSQSQMNRTLLRCLQISSASISAYHFRPEAEGKETGRGACAEWNYIRAVSCVTPKSAPR